ncbi:unnamed protein product [Protopolystoma xenopodis]|uniref:Uncharacterized protein n=1 Tax=Protopolystoma xenopodis TaxID=117903 RepID=A0A448X2N5_9PLAT|nr:unnamed protein product [Protopolystoma xenopodis]
MYRIMGIVAADSQAPSLDLSIPENWDSSEGEIEPETDQTGLNRPKIAASSRRLHKKSYNSQLPPEVPLLSSQPVSPSASSSESRFASRSVSGSGLDIGQKTLETHTNGV